MSIERSIWNDKENTAVVDAGREGAKVIEQDGSTIRSFIQQNSPLNNEMIRNAALNDLYTADIDGQIQLFPTIVRKKHGKMEPVVSYVSFSYDDTADLEIFNRKGLFNITAYDRRVYNAVSTLFINGRNIISLSEIFSVMTGYTRTNPAKRQIAAIEKSLEKLKSIRVYIDMTDEVRHKLIEDHQPLIDVGVLKDYNDKIKRAVIEDHMLHFRKGELVSENGRVFKSIQIIAEPILLTYNRAKKSLLTIPMEYIGLEGQKTTDKTIAFQDYLLMRIFSYKNKKMYENKILYDTLYRDAGQEKPEDSKGFIRDRETVVRMLQEWQDKGLITSFAEIKEGRSYTGIIFFTEQITKKSPREKGRKASENK